VDEVHFTNRSNLRYEWAANRKHIKVVQKQFMMKRWNMVAAVSEEVGMEAAILYDKPVNSRMFV
jgi:hypothetical protein